VQINHLDIELQTDIGDEASILNPEVYLKLRPCQKVKPVFHDLFDFNKLPVFFLGIARLDMANGPSSLHSFPSSSFTIAIA
jgi:hypothetical protein